jgi:hypothetical protein
VPVCVVCPISAFALNSRPKALVECFSQIPDRRGRVHPLPAVLGLAACAVAAEHSTPTEIRQWCQDAGQELSASLGARYDALTGRYLAPGRDKVARVLARMDPEILDCAVCRSAGLRPRRCTMPRRPMPQHPSRWRWTGKRCAARAAMTTRPWR